MIATLQTPLGRLGLVEQDGAIVELLWQVEEQGETTPLLAEGCRQLAAYFEGRLERFDLDLRPKGSGFQKSVCAAMQTIPLGETWTYGQIAAAMGTSAQAVGTACGANPIPVIIPCHRVLAATGLGGYSGSGGVETKVWLLRHEKAGGLLI